MRNEYYEGAYHASFETGCSEENEIIEEFITLIEGLTPKAKRLWDHCTKRVFDFGYECDGTPSTFHTRINENAINSMAKVGGSVVVTIYPSVPEKR